MRNWAKRAQNGPVSSSLYGRVSASVPALASLREALPISGKKQYTAPRARVSICGASPGGGVRRSLWEVSAGDQSPSVNSKERKLRLELSTHADLSAFALGLEKALPFPST